MRIDEYDRLQQEIESLAPEVGVTDVHSLAG